MFLTQQIKMCDKTNKKVLCVFSIHLEKCLEKCVPKLWKAVIYC